MNTHRSFLIVAFLIAVTWGPRTCWSGPGDLLYSIPHPFAGPDTDWSFFGDSIAVSGGDIIVGAKSTHFRSETGETVKFVGAAYVFNANDGSLRLELQPPQVVESLSFGTAVAAIDDTVFVGAPKSSIKGEPAYGLYGYSRLDGSRLFETFSLGSTGLGTGLAVLDDRRVVTVAPSEMVDGLASVGAVYVIDGDTGEILNHIPHPVPQRNAILGALGAVATSGDRIVVGSITDDPNGPTMIDGSLVPPGGAYVLDSSSGDFLFRLENPEPGSQNKLPLADFFGFMVAASPSTMYVRSANEDVDGVLNAGAVHVFDAQDGSFLRTLVSPQPAELEAFGNSILPVGNNVLIGAPDASVDGKAYLFDPETGELILELAGPAGAVNFGAAAAEMNGDLLIAAPLAFVNQYQSGALYLFEGVVSDPDPGDADRDGDVDGADLSRLLSNWTGMLEPGQANLFFGDGNFDSDGDVDGADLTLLLAHWTGEKQALRQAVAGVPEPNGILWIFCCLLMGLLGFRRSRSVGRR